jgi:hypothetical protein
MVFDLAIQQTPTQRSLVTASQAGVHVLKPDTMEPETAYDANRPIHLTLSVAVDPGGKGHLWAGTAFEGVYHYDPEAGTWALDASPGGPVFSLWIEGADAPWTRFAGTNDGVYQDTGTGAWQAMNETASTASVAIQNTSVGALCRVSDRLLAGTAQRGLWGRDAAVWTRLSEGLPPLGRLIDAAVPVGDCAWSMAFDGPQQEGEVDTYVLYLPENECDELRFERTLGAVELAVYYVSGYTDVAQGRWAGLQQRALEIAEPISGFYLLTVTALSDTQYEVIAETVLAD